MFTTSANTLCPIISYELSSTDLVFTAPDTHFTPATGDVTDRSFIVNIQDLLSTTQYLLVKSEGLVTSFNPIAFNISCGNENLSLTSDKLNYVFDRQNSSAPVYIT